MQAKSRKITKKIISMILMIMMIFSVCIPASAQAQEAAVAANVTEVAVGETTKLSVYGWNLMVTWTSSDEDVATVNGWGKVTGVSVGEATISAKALSIFGITTTTEFTVSVTPVNADATIEVGETLEITVDGNETTTWTTSDEAIATVENGTVTGVGEGIATITAKTTKRTGFFWFFFWGKKTTVVETFIIEVIDPQAEESTVVTHNVSFMLNDGSTGAYEVQMVIDGETANEPIDPERSKCTFTGWFTEPECENVFDFSTAITQDTDLYAGWDVPEDDDSSFSASSGGGTVYSISGVEMNDKYVRSTINVNGICTLRVQFLTEDTKRVITTVSTQTPEYCELTPVSIFVGARLPEYFIIVADLLDDNGEKLCDSFTCMLYTKAYEQFANQTIHDFEGKTVINFDEKEDKNYGVLADDVKTVVTGETTNKFTVSPQPIIPDDYDGTQEIEYENYYIFENPDEQVTDLEVGDKIYIEDTQYLFKIGSIETSSDGTVIITENTDTQLTDFYQVLNVDISYDVNTGRLENNGVMPIEDHNTDKGDNFPLNFSTKITPSDNIEIIGTINGIGYTKIKIIYDIEIFEENYYSVTVTKDMTFMFNAQFNIVVDNKDEVEDSTIIHKDVKKIELGKFVIPTTIPGLTLSLKPAIPVEWEISAGLEIVYTSITTSGFSFGSDGKQEIDKKQRTLLIEAKGKATVKIGPELKFSVDFCGEVLKASLSISGGVKGTAKVEAYAFIASDADEAHICGECINIEGNWYIEVNASVSYKIIEKKWEGKFVDWDIVKVEGKNPLKFYNSLINDDDSIYGGNIKFGLGECKNKVYRTDFIVKDPEGSELSNIDISVYKESGEAVDSGESPYRLYMYAGKYKAVCTVDGFEVEKTFKVEDSAQTITLNAVSNGSLSGKICKASDRITPISNATIEIYKNGALYTTKQSNSDGTYTLRLAAGDYLVKISSDGYIDFKSYATVVADNNTYMETFLMIEGEEGTVGTANGKVINSLTGSGVSDVTLEILADWNNNDEDAEVITTVKTNSSGAYTVDLPIGNYTVRASKENYTTAFFNIVVQNGTTSNQNGTITPVVSEGEGNNYLITLTWGQNPDDLDSHMVGESNGSEQFHVYFGNKTYGDECALDYDDTSSYGPEHITLVADEDDTYYYYIYHYSGSGAIITSEAKITVEQGNTLIAVFNVPTDLSTDRYWNVFAIKDGKLIVNNTITTSANTSYAD